MRTSIAALRLPSRIATRRSPPMPTGSSSGSALTWCSRRPSRRRSPASSRSANTSSLNEAIEADVKDYFLTNYKEQVLKPELRDQTITKGVEQAVRHAHDSYRRVIANGDMRLQLFLAQHTSHLEDIPASTPMTNVKLDWDAQKWKAPTYLMEDRAFDGIAGRRRRCRRRHGRARWRLAPRSTACWRRASAQLSRRVATSLGTRLAFAEQGAIAGTVVQPMGGQVVGAAIGVADRRRGRLSVERGERGDSTARASSRRTMRRSTPPSPPGSRAWKPISTRRSTNGSTTPAPRWS